jgi:hypothetical protein
MHVAVVVEDDPSDDALDESVGVVRSLGGTISVVALAEPVVVAVGTGWVSPAVVTGFPQSSSAGAANLARRVVDRLPTDIPVNHFVCFGWRCPRLLGRLRSGAFDLVVLAEWPVSRLACWALIRAARAGNTPIWAPPRRRTVFGMLFGRRERTARAMPAYAHEAASSS